MPLSSFCKRTSSTKNRPRPRALFPTSMKRPLACLLLSPFPLSAQEAPSILADGAQVQLLADGFKFTEGPAADAAGNVYFTDQPHNRIWKWSTEGKLSLWKEPAGRANGLYFDPAGRLIACADEKNELWRLSLPEGRVEVLVGQLGGRRLNGPNDVWVHPDGGIYFTDPFYKRDYWTRGPAELEGQHVYYLAKNATAPAAVARDLQQPNGLVGSADGQILYVADIRAKQTWRYAVHPDGSLADKVLFCPMGSDGMTLDAAGNLYLTGQGVTVFNSQGTKIGHIPINESWTANACFGGALGDTLFITAMDSLYAVKTKVKWAR